MLYQSHTYLTIPAVKFKGTGGGASSIFQIWRIDKRKGYHGIVMMPSALSAQADIQQVSRWNVGSAEGLGSSPLRIRQMIYRSDGLHVVVQRGRDFLILSRNSSGRDKVTPIGTETPVWVDADGKGTFLVATVDSTSRALVHEIDTEGRVKRNWSAPDNFPLGAVFFSDSSPVLFSQHGQWLRAEGPLSDAVRMSFESNPASRWSQKHLRRH
jgi:hypothetical protein